MIGFQENRANELLVEDGKLTGEVAEPILGREAKLATLIELREALRPRRRSTRWSIGDGANDLGMIQAAGLGVAYHAKPAVAAAAARADRPRRPHRAAVCAGLSAGRVRASRQRIQSAAPSRSAYLPKTSPRSDGCRMRRHRVTRLLHAQRHEPQFAVGVRDQQQHRLLAVLLQLIDALLDVGGVGRRLPARPRR